ncbi:hypothetical protein [Halorhabdus amylolytica]|uniref:hypothetical protein n=1 Tax=Halorhabdus amylolytica TaxID=2559573 RepID=UPI0010AA8C46|nr:hypothetical protein [Halorhabdus amylolytica]
MAKPGRFPGEAAITRAEYDRWLAAIGDVANVVRTYTIHPPAFYRALAAYNEGTSDPLLLLQGTWVPTGDLLEAGDATELSETVDAELERTVDVVHGQTTLPERPGHAAGRYDADVSEASLGYLFGIEWPPEVVTETNERGDEGDYEGTYLQTRDGSPFERWLAGRLERIVARESEAYDTQRPVSFVNWVTTDPLEHPYEPFRDEDSASIDPDAIRSTDAFDAGTLGSYHVYPYYPDLLNETPAYVEYVDHRGDRNNYAGYLNHLVEVTDHPVLVAEFGVPSSRGIAHRNVHGRHQGRHTEREQGEIIAAMFEDVVQAGTAGGIVFSWQNEWFKRTWNLDARSVPGRRPFWSNVETPEQRFGLLAFDPVDGVRLDGSLNGWEDATRIEPARKGNARSERTLTSLQVTHDLEGLNYRLEFEDLPEPIDWTSMNALVTIGLTGRTMTLPLGTDADVTADFVVHLAGPGDSRLLVDSRYDAFAREFGTEAGLPLEAYRDGSAGFVPVREPINLGYTVPATGKEVPFEAVETGQLRYGNGNPDAASYDSLTDVHVDAAGNVVEGRLPWILLNVADPSSKQRIATDWDEGLDNVGFDGVTIGAATFAPRSDGDGRAAVTDGPTNVVDAVPGRDGSVVRTAEYTWDPWEKPAYQERLKESYDILREELS